MAFFDAPGFIMEVFISNLSFHTAFHCYPTLLFLFPQSSAFYPIMSPSSPKSGPVKQLPDIPQPHDFETFRFSKDYEAFRRQVILPTIRGSHDHQDISYLDKLALPFRYHLPLPGPQLSLSTNLFWILISIRPIVSHWLIMSTTLLINPPLFQSLGTLLPMAILAWTFQDALFQMKRWHIGRVI
jgi:hypothetical protein